MHLATLVAVDGSMEGSLDGEVEAAVAEARGPEGLACSDEELGVGGSAGHGDGAVAGFEDRESGGSEVAGVVAGVEAGASVDRHDEPAVGGFDGDLDGGVGREPEMEEVDLRGFVDRGAGSGERAGDDACVGTVAEVDLGELVGGVADAGWRDLLRLGWEADEDLGAVAELADVFDGFFVDDAGAGDGPVDAAGLDEAVVAEAVAVADRGGRVVEGT